MAPRTLAPVDPRPRLRLVSGAAPSHPSAEEDARLAAAFEAGVAGAGAALYARLLPVVDATLARILGRREQDHADLVQSAFEQIVATLSRRRFGGNCSLAGWAAALSCHVGLNALRSRRRERAVVDRDRTVDGAAWAGVAAGRGRTAAGDGVEAELEARDRLDVVRRHLAAMDVNRATVVLLHAMGYELADIATLTKTSVAAAQSRLSRGRRDLRARIEADVRAGATGRGPDDGNGEGGRCP